MAAESSFWGSIELVDGDAEVFGLIEKEKKRQGEGLCLIASENFTSRATLQALGSSFTNKYAEGYPGKRYYGGTEVCDELELLCQKRALQAFSLNDADWGVNVQVYSGSAANFVVYDGLLQPHDRIMGLDLSHGGHLSHGFRTPTRRITSAGKYFESMPYQLDPATGRINYDELERHSLLFRPKLIVCGASAYPRDWEYARLRTIADRIGAYLLCDMAHTSGLILGGKLSSPFDFCDVVTTTTHKTLRGPRGALVFYRKTMPAASQAVSVAAAKPYDLGEKINASVFPGNQGGPHMNAIAAVAVALGEASKPEFREYATLTVENARSLAAQLLEKGYKLVTDGTDNHIVLVDLRPKGINGSKVEKACERAGIYLNKNAVPGDANPAVPYGVRLGSPCMTSRGLKPEDFEKIAGFFDQVVNIAVQIQATTGQQLKDFVDALPQNEELETIRKAVDRKSVV